MILLPRVLLTMERPPWPGGAVAVRGNKIAALGTAAELEAQGHGPLVSLGETALLPGLINAHCHLDYSTLRDAISHRGSFTSWVQRLNAVKRTLTSDDYLEAIARGFAELARWGTTSVCNVEAFPELMPSLPAPPLRTWWFYEMIDIRHRHTTEEVVQGALAFFGDPGEPLSRYGLNPHAPYTASARLYDLANACASEQKMLLTTHVAESREEAEMFGQAQGPLYDFLSSLERPMGDCGHGSPFALLWESGRIDHRWILVHLNELTEWDFQLLAEAPEDQRPSIVHCPGSHAFFEHSRFPFRRLRALGANICLGTDSLASTRSLSLFAEMRAFQAREPQLTGEELLQLVTVNPARALQEEGCLGVIRAGALADLIAVPVGDRLDNVYQEVVEFRQPVPWTMIDGKILSH